MKNVNAIAKELYKIDVTESAMSDEFIHINFKAPSGIIKGKFVKHHEFIDDMRDWLISRGVVPKIIYYGKDNVTVGWCGTEAFYRNDTELNNTIKLTEYILSTGFKQ